MMRIIVMFAHLSNYTHRSSITNSKIIKYSRFRFAIKNSIIRVNNYEVQFLPFDSLNESGRSERRETKYSIGVQVLRAIALK